MHLTHLGTPEPVVWERNAGCPNDLHILLASTLGVSSVAKICGVTKNVALSSGLGRDLNTVALIYHRVGSGALSAVLFYDVYLEFVGDKDNEAAWGETS